MDDVQQRQQQQLSDAQESQQHQQEGYIDKTVVFQEGCVAVYSPTFNDLFFPEDFFL